MTEWKKVAEIDSKILKMMKKHSTNIALQMVAAKKAVESSVNYFKSIRPDSTVDAPINAEVKPLTNSYEALMNVYQDVVDVTLEANDLYDRYEGLIPAHTIDTAAHYIDVLTFIELYKTFDAQQDNLKELYDRANKLLTSIGSQHKPDTSDVRTSIVSRVEEQFVIYTVEISVLNIHDIKSYSNDYPGTTDITISEPVIDTDNADVDSADVITSTSSTREKSGDIIYQVTVSIPTEYVTDRIIGGEEKPVDVYNIVASILNGIRL